MSAELTRAPLPVRAEVTAKIAIVGDNATLRQQLTGFAAGKRPTREERPAKNSRTGSPAMVTRPATEFAPRASHHPGGSETFFKIKREIFHKLFLRTRRAVVKKCVQLYGRSGR